LRNHNFDLEIISKIRVHPEFLSPAVRRDVEAGLKERMLGDYVSNVKMKIVADSCAKIHGMLARAYHPEAVHGLTFETQRISQRGFLMLSSVVIMRVIPGN